MQSRICGANFGNMFLCEDNTFRAVAMHNAPEAYANARNGAPICSAHPTVRLDRLVVTSESRASRRPEVRRNDTSTVNRSLSQP